MPESKHDIITRLQRQILLMQGGSGMGERPALDMGLGLIEQAFPGNCFPVAGIHEFISMGSETRAAAGGFIAGLLSVLLKTRGVCVWISTGRSLFPPALTGFGVDPGKLIFIDVTKERDALWAMEEVLKCEGFAAVVGEIQNISFTQSRRLQLAVEDSKVTGFLLRSQQKNLSHIACVARWQIQSLASALPLDMPGVGFPNWRVELVKVRNGKPGNWEVAWVDGKFRSLTPGTAAQETYVLTRKAG